MGRVDAKVNFELKDVIIVLTLKKRVSLSEAHECVLRCILICLVFRCTGMLNGRYGRVQERLLRFGARGTGSKSNIVYNLKVSFLG